MGAQLFLLIATVLSIDGGEAVLDKGLMDGLLPGDQGAIYYELKVAGRPRRLDAGEGKLTAIEPGTSRLSVGEAGIKPGYQVEFRVPAERIRPQVLLESAQAHLDEVAQDEVREALRAQIEADQLAVTPPPATPEPVPDVSAETSVAEKEVVAAAPERPMLLVPAGAYAIGRDASETRFFNEQPQHEVTLDVFRIDLTPSERVSEGDQPPTWHEADAHCRSLNLRLPTEQEWEAAHRMTELPTGRLLEWTSSHYLAYPGNTHPEKNYGDQYYTIRGNPPDQDSDSYRRRFATPGTRDTDLGFRCAESVRDEWR